MLEKLLETAKLKTISSIFERVAPGTDSRIRTWMSVVGTETSRYAHSETFLEESTNLGNLPKKQALYDEAYNVRKIFIPTPGSVLLEADYSQAEARAAAWMANDTLAKQQYVDKVDRYAFFAAHLFHGGDVSKVVKMERNTIGKEGILSCQYGVQWQTVLRRVNMLADLTGYAIDAKTAKRAVDLFASLYPSYAVWWEETLAEVLEKGYLVNPFGFRRIFFAPTDSDNALASLKREAVAFLPQSTIAHMLNRGMRELWETYDKPGCVDGGKVRILLQVHDSVLMEVREGEAMKMAHVVKRVLEEQKIVVRGETLTIPVEVAVGPTWADLKQIL